ncbi:MAG: hypothetical protein HQ541_19270, partial [Mariniphaga sp.]|nr:hypothetical protein [Mariniphaga sp.]
MGKVIAILFLLLVSFMPAVGQQVANDSIPIQKEEIHSPKKATIYSAILPGLGQAYNKKYWKIPIIYAGFGVIVYFIDYNNNWYRLFKNAYVDLSVTTGFDKEVFISKYKEDLPLLSTIDYDNSVEMKNTLDYLTKYQDYSRRNRDLLIIGTAVFYALNIIDASVDAHLFDFDI